VSLNSVVTLNVGGTQFITTRQTLLSDPASMLAKMFNPESSLRPGLMKDGAYFIDRDPKYFPYVLNYLRNGQILLDSDISLEAIKCEASYFGLVNLEEELNGRIDMKKTDADKIQANLSEWSYFPKEAEIKRAALLAWEGHLISVKYMKILNESITDIPRGQMEKLASIVTEKFVIDNMTHNDHLGSILTSVKCPSLCLEKMDLGVAETQALVTAMRDRVKKVELRDVTLDIEWLTHHDGKGRCKELRVGRDMWNRYYDKLMRWWTDKGWMPSADNEGWIVMKRIPCLTGFACLLCLPCLPFLLCVLCHECLLSKGRPKT